MSKFHYMTIKKVSVIDIPKGKMYDHYIFRSTDSDTLDWLADTVNNSSYELTDIITYPSGNKYGLAIDKIEKFGGDASIKWWLLTRLCQQGWEPFAIEPAPEMEPAVAGDRGLTEKDTMHLRKQSDY